MNLPKVTFIYAYPLDRGQRELFTERGIDYPPMETIKSVINDWEKLWTETNDKYSLISRLVEITGRVPERSLECFVFGSGLSPMSTPFLLPIWNRERKQRSDEKFIDTMIHELLHIFLITNNNRFWEEVRNKFSNETPVTQSHIHLYAMLYEIYQQVFDREPMDFGRSDLPVGYARAVQLVKEIGYKELIGEYRSFH